VDDNGIHLYLLVDCTAEPLQTLGRVVVRVQSEVSPNFFALLFVQSENDVEILLKRGNQFERAADILFRPFLRVGKVNKRMRRAPSSKGILHLDGLPNVTHVSEHRQLNPTSRASSNRKFIFAEPALDILPVHLFRD
jgi:hypothetical protein